MDYFTDMSPLRKAWEGAGGAIVTGIICGFLATVTWWAYLVALLVTFVGGLGAGAQHRTARGAALRGVVAGGLWGAALAIVIGLTGRDPIALIPVPAWTMVLYSIVVTVIATLSSWAVARSRARQPKTPTPEPAS